MLLLSRVIPTDSGWLERMTTSGRVDGVIVIGQSDQSATLDAVAARYKPLVVWGGHGAGQVHCSVGSDNRKGGDLAASHLIAQGVNASPSSAIPRRRKSPSGWTDAAMPWSARVWRIS
jgi:DNA-binding LacI/PurR family transcriptional regulator